MAILGHLRALLGPGEKDVAEGCLINWFVFLVKLPSKQQTYRGQNHWTICYMISDSLDEEPIRMLAQDGRTLPQDAPR